MLIGLLRLGLDLTQPDRNLRPPMADVVLALKDLLAEDGGPSRFYSRPELLRLSSEAAENEASHSQGPSSGAPSDHPSLFRSVTRPQRVCFVCEDRARTTLFEPCLHAMCCVPCAKAMLEASWFRECYTWGALSSYM